ncbi:riboflavin synthase alpha chain [Acetitomaculum ruminis DSM 5522]|uniref:Riboflavin synthase n=1 Tax=Acetitomaculum ruminis DSM 5522 TaxID=1120918 RepID=A0A1I0XYJ5_9FIRM|nr:riboflavin synthase [Acetitomaculum ruminis]SFB05974.1 riboflavin synthase alpha chain [Acetitomaculum ruminis DSM 5522]
MFTGIVEEMGTYLKKTSTGEDYTIRIGAKLVLEGSKIGDSIAVNGICLTVVNMGNDYFEADVMPETLQKSSLGQLSVGDKVNLERAMPLNGRFGGHIVSGHIDSTGNILSIKEDKNAVWFEIGCEKKVLKYIVEKGSVTLDGISLTVAKVLDDSFKVSIIPHTLSQTVLGEKKRGSLINIENDILGKYVERLINLKNDDERESKSTLSESFLLENGFL